MAKGVAIRYSLTATVAAERGTYMIDTKKQNRVTKTTISGTVYIVESMVSDNATETAYIKVKRLILSNLKEELKLSNTSHLLSEIDSTSAK